MEDKIILLDLQLPKVEGNELPSRFPGLYEGHGARTR